jgi:hypothetical protein
VRSSAYHGACVNSSQFPFLKQTLVGLEPTQTVLTGVLYLILFGYMWLFFLTLYRRALASAWTPAPRKHRYAFRKHGYELDVPKLGG